MTTLTCYHGLPQALEIQKAECPSAKKCLFFIPLNCTKAELQVFLKLTFFFFASIA